MTDSYISKTGLDMLLASLKTAVPAGKALQSLEKFALNKEDRTALYTGIVEILESGYDVRTASKHIIEGLEQIMKVKTALVQDNMFESEEEKCPQQSGGTGKLFRRVG